MVKGKDRKNMSQLVHSLEKEAAEREEKRQKKKRKVDWKGARRVSEDTKRVRELEIEAVERKEAIKEKQRKEGKKKAKKQKDAEMAIEDVIGKFVRD
ncbi:MAG: hypothetical protein JRJ82_22980 [Deltaproteobacteria bacterium]|nr:hypothetical protein [Deltaproteobacteria bacterium]